MVYTLMRLGTASRADLAKATGLSQPTAGKIADELLEAGMLEQGEDASADNRVRRMGRPAQLLRLDRQTPRFLAVQLGVDHTRLAMLPVAVQDRDDWAVRLPAAGDPVEWVEQLRNAARQLRPAQLEAVLLTVPGVVDERAGQALLCPNLRWAESVNLIDLIGKVWKAPVCIVQEIRALALGHQAIESPADDFLLVDFGDGVGGAAVVNGELFESPIPLSGELGHTPVLGNQRQCGCGAVGCVETLVSRRGLLDTFAAETRKTRSWPALFEHIAECGVEPWLASTLDTAAITIAGALNVLGVRQAVITGSLNELPAPVMQHLSAAVVRGAMWARFGEVLCHSAPRRRTAGLVSAAIDRILLADEAAA